MDQLTIQIGESLGSILDDFQFKKTRWHVIKSTPEGWVAIEIDTIRTSNPGCVKLAAHGQVRIDAVESAYAPFHPYLSSGDAKWHPTITINCDELVKDKSLAGEFSDDSSSVAMFAKSYACSLLEDVIPWLESYSSEESVYRGLVSNSPLEWITSDRLTRFTVLLTILARRGDLGGFDRVAHDFLVYCDIPGNKVHLPLAESVTSGLRRDYL